MVRPVISYSSLIGFATFSSLERRLWLVRQGHFRISIATYLSWLLNHHHTLDPLLCMPHTGQAQSVNEVT